MDIRTRRSNRLIAPALAVLLLAGCVPSGFRTSKTMEQNAIHMSQTPVTVISRNGSVQVIADPTLADIQISARITCGGATQAQADDRLADASIDVSRDLSRRLTIKPVFPGGERNGDGASITVRLPDACGIEVDTSNGAVVLRGLTGEAIVDTSNGSVTVEDHNGQATLETSNGRVTVTGHVGPLDVDTSNGSVKAHQIAGPVRIRTSNSSITFSLAPDQPGPIRLDTSNGAIRATVGPAFVGRVRLDTSNARLRIEDHSGRMKSQSVHRSRATVVVGEGGSVSNLDTSNGGITFIVEG
ncbi:MAG: DUF4097 family beta strand repeat protein [Phycisphaerales bacterium]|nr:MAG: DUF4097 family beta strand repeat protein [Phycisphaerales bacterium]